ncbi:D-alanyl-D-alanine carboxypeptidase family protein [Rhodoligotrophos ferricapiens]|uniref:D-alanyl-D-alanine carboxypeptidase family protein n=1 Tax=Rhodoligotrophos ferricapiens TaxID=3069264 RepID=UPI00315CB59C
MRLHRPAVIALLILAMVWQTGAALAGPTLVFEAVSGRVIAGENESEPWHPASLTKLMTAYVTFLAIKAGRFSLDSDIVYSERASVQPPSKIGLKPGSTLKLDLALEGMLVRSANDFAVAIAENVGGSFPRFIQLMNETARQIGMTGTYYANPHGLPDIRQVTTARDLGILVNNIIRDFPEYQHYFSDPAVSVGNRQLANRNSLLRQMKGADGMKTGYICSSGYNLIGSATVDGRRLVAVVLGAKSGGSRTAIAQSLLEQGFSAPVGDRTVYGLKPGALARATLPSDLTPLVCNWKPSYEITKPEDLQGWGVALGRFGAPDVAYDMMNKWLLGTRYVFYGGRGVVVKMPFKGDYLVMVDDLSDTQSQAICSYLQSNEAPCQVMTPDNFARMAQENQEEIAQRKAAGAKVEAASAPGREPAQGNDSDE